MDIMNVIDRLDALVGTSTKVPATRSRLVDSEKLMELLQQLRLAIPQGVRASQEVIARKDIILNQAQIDARRTRAEAEEEFATRLNENEMVLAARRAAEQLTEDAERKADRLIEQSAAESRRSRSDADAYVVQVLRTLENEMTSVLGSVRKGLETLGANARV